MFVTDSNGYLGWQPAELAVGGTSADIPNTIVARDGSGNFAAGQITAGSILSGAITSTGVVSLTQNSLPATGAMLQEGPQIISATPTWFGINQGAQNADFANFEHNSISVFDIDYRGDLAISGTVSAPAAMTFITSDGANQGASFVLEDAPFGCEFRE